jgi:hypothetical protein
MPPDQSLYIERDGYTWLQYPDRLYYGPRWPNEEAPLVRLESHGTLGHSSVRRGAYRYFLGRVCRTFPFWAQNPKSGCQNFDDLETPKLSKKQICARYGPAHGGKARANCHTKEDR